MKKFGDHHILIEELVLDAWVGIHEHEQCLQKISFDISIVLKNQNHSDSIDNTLDYETLINQIKDFLLKKKYSLLETLVENVMNLILEYPMVKHAHISAGKPSILNTKKISISLSGTNQ